MGWEQDLLHKLMNSLWLHSEILTAVRRTGVKAAPCLLKFTLWKDTLTSVSSILTALKKPADSLCGKEKSEDSQQPRLRLPEYHTEDLFPLQEMYSCTFCF